VYIKLNFTKRIPSLANLSYPERLAALDLEPLELRRLKSDLVLYYKCLHDLLALPSSEYFTVSNVTSQTRTGGNRLLRPLCSTKLMKTTFLIAVYLVGIFCLIQWSMLAPFRVSNAFYLTLICHPLHVVFIFNNL